MFKFILLIIYFYRCTLVITLPWWQPSQTINDLLYKVVPLSPSLSLKYN